MLPFLPFFLKLSSRAMPQWTFCLIALFLLSHSNGLQAQCNPDTIPPICIPPADTVVDCSAVNLRTVDSTFLAQNFGTATATDNCIVEIRELNFRIETDDCEDRKVIRSFVARDTSGNTSTIVEQVIELETTRDYIIVIPGDHDPSQPTIDSLNVLNNACQLVSFAFANTLFDFDCDDQTDLIVKQHTIIDWCGPVADQPLVIESFDVDGDGQTGDPFEVHVRGDSVFRVADGLPEQYLGPNASLFQYTQRIRLNYNDTLLLQLDGNVFVDTDSSCWLDAGEEGLANWQVKATSRVTGNIYTDFTDSLGNYEFSVCPQDTSLIFSLVSPINYAQGCATRYLVNVPFGTRQFTRDLPVQLNDNCPILQVDISAPFLRRCFDNSYYIHYCNYSADTIYGAYVEATFDPFFEVYDSISGFSGIDLGNNTYQFNVGDLAPGQCEQLRVFGLISCESVFGQTHCSSAHIFPDSLCDQGGAEWSRASIEVDSYCDGDSVQMIISNTGLGDMTQEASYIVVEDVLMRSGGTVQLNSGESEFFAVPANGATWYLEVDQVPGHPGSSMPSVVIEGCGGNNEPGLAAALPHDDGNPFVAIDCQANIGSFDPNDKQVFPTGIGPQHFVEANTDLDYLIRFQNTGTDTAFNIRIVDTLSNLHDPATFRPGASSHPYTVELNDANVITFSFNNIQLPDSNVNLEGSNGFVRFKIAQKKDLADGNRIENSAAIYFDFNDPIITNTTFLTIGREIFDDTPVSLSPVLSNRELQIFPNPFDSHTTFRINGDPLKAGTLECYDLSGRLMHRQNFIGHQCELRKENLQGGCYIYQVRENNRLISRGKLLVH